MATILEVRDNFGWNLSYRRLLNNWEVERLTEFYNTIEQFKDFSINVGSLVWRKEKKALSRRASLFEMIRDYGRAASDFQRLVSLLTRHMENKAGGSASKISFVNEIRQTQQKLSTMEEEARKEIPLNFYLLLGVDPSVGASEIRKAYRKAALKHHPDKAGQSLARNDNADDGLWKEIAEEVHKDADKLFKMIGEAYAVLSDSAKRSRYDLEEEMRNNQSRGTESSTFRAHTDFNTSHFERSGNRGHWEDVWRAYKST